MQDQLTRLVNNLSEEVDDVIASGKIFGRHNFTESVEDSIKILGNKYTILMTLRKKVYVTPLKNFQDNTIEVAMVANSDQIYEGVFEETQSKPRLIEKIRTNILMAHSQYVEGKPVKGATLNI